MGDLTITLLCGVLAFFFFYGLFFFVVDVCAFVNERRRDAIARSEMEYFKAKWQQVIEEEAKRVERKNGIRRVK